MGAALNNPIIHSQLNDLQSCTPYLKISAGRRCLSAGAPFANVANFDACLISTLLALSTALFVNNASVTYPMKSLLLITGLMPAFDSQVKGGLARAGVSGVNKTRYPLPMVGSNDPKKICSLPFYIADCMSRQATVFSREVSSSLHPCLATEHGRIFDVLLFIQNGGAHNTITFSWSTGDRWYNA
jgi:hypothetical protein